MPAAVFSLLIGTEDPPQRQAKKINYQVCANDIPVSYATGKVADYQKEY
jgi:hypothetical protein